MLLFSIFIHYTLSFHRIVDSVYAFILPMCAISQNPSIFYWYLNLIWCHHRVARVAVPIVIAGSPIPPINADPAGTIEVPPAPVGPVSPAEVDDDPLKDVPDRTTTTNPKNTPDILPEERWSLSRKTLSSSWPTSTPKYHHYHAVFSGRTR